MLAPYYVPVSIKNENVSKKESRANDPQTTIISKSEFISQKFKDIELAMYEEKYDSAIKLLVELDILKRYDYSINYNLGICYFQKKDYKNVIDRMDRAIQIKPKNHEPYKYLAEAYEKTEELELSAHIYNKYANILNKDEKISNSDKAFAYYNVGISWHNVDEEEKSFNSFQKAVELDEKLGDAWHHIGMHYFSLSKNKQALSAFDKAIKNNASPENKATAKAFIDSIKSAK